MNTQVIIGIVIAVVLLVALIGGAGYALQRRRRITLTPPETREVDGTREADKSGGYQAGSGFSFSQGGTAVAEKPEPTPEPAKKGPESVADEAERILAGAESEPITPVADDPIAQLPGTEVESIDDAMVVEEAAEAARVETGVEPGVQPDEQVVPEPEPEPAAEEPEETAPAAPVRDEIAPTEGRLSRLRGRLARSQGAIGTSMLGLLGAGDLDEDSWEEIEDTLVMADLGTAATTAVVDGLRAELATGKVRSAADARAALHRVLVEQLHPELDRSVRALPHAGGPAVVLVVGVNGVGKTTTTGKLARVLVADGRRVLLGAADTFRAAAADQLQTWGERVGAGIVRGKEGADPASVAFDAVSTGIDEGVDVVLIDTAGRLHTKTGLMDELGKVKRVVEKKTPVDEVLLVLDATVGQNGLTQAKVFAEVVDLTGVVLTKLDGTAKGGIVFRIQEELGVPVKLVGLGEGADDLAPFEPGAFVDALL
ncbi:signal recognition particle-docking protein FtsY [Gordonia sp. FQ]|uniref:signal recognition particle-docking protein FtsY n=1 Tax=Gordonia sp. FQ TaxID=3446634 RepID=UPI003F862087